MNFISLTEESGRHSSAAAQALASAVESQTGSMTRSRPELLEMDEVDKMETLLSPDSLEDVYGHEPIELLLGHKDFRRMVHLLESMGLQGTAHLRQLRNGTKRLATLVGDTMHAFEQGKITRSILQFLSSRLLLINSTFLATTRMAQSAIASKRKGFFCKGPHQALFRIEADVGVL